MRYLMTLLLLCGLAFVAVPTAVAQQAPAATPGNPYQAVVPVADTSAAHRSDAFAKALAEVLSRLSDHAPPASALSKASIYVRQYQYQRAPAGSPQAFQLMVDFAPSAIRHLQHTLAAPPSIAGADSDEIPGMPSSFGGGDSKVWVSGIHSARDFANALATLRDEPGVDDIAVRKAEGNGMLLDVHTTVALARVLAELGSTGRFAVSGEAHAGAAASLRWQE